MLDTPRRLAVTGADPLGFAVLAGRSADNTSVQVLIGNYEIPESHRNRPAGEVVPCRGCRRAATSTIRTIAVTA